MIKIIFVGKVKDQWLKEAIAEYVKRLGRFTKVELFEVKDSKIMGKDSDRIMKEEGERILRHIKDSGDEYVITLEIDGKEMASEKFALEMGKLIDKNLVFVVGGALGLSKEVLKRSNFKMSLSKMTLTNQMVRVLLVEQIYRAYMINAGREYHK